MSLGKVYVILVNYNGWQDTAECLESLMRSEHENFQVVVVDNASTDHSIEKLQLWAKGEQASGQLPENSELKALCEPQLKKPIPFIHYSIQQAMNGGSGTMEEAMTSNEDYISTYPIVFISSEKNAGFSAGNNIGVRFAQHRNDFSHIWLLNNDTIVPKDALKELHHFAINHEESGLKTGIIGSKILYYDYPETIQVIGGFSFNKWTGTSHRLGAYEKDNGQYDKEVQFDRMHCIFGASMFVSKEFLDDVGSLSEDYFMYWEELDWAQRGFQKGWEIGYAWKSKVYHKMGRSTGKDGFTRKKGKFADYYGLKNRYKVSRRYFPETALAQYFTFPALLVKRILKGEINRVPTAIRAFIDSHENGKSTKTYEINQTKSTS